MNVVKSKHETYQKNYEAKNLHRIRVFCDICYAIMQNMIFDSVFEVDSVLENKSDF